MKKLASIFFGTIFSLVLFSFGNIAHAATYDFVDESGHKIIEVDNGWEYIYKGTGNKVWYDDSVDKASGSGQAYHFFKGPETETSLHILHKHYIKVKATAVNADPVTDIDGESGSTGWWLKVDGVEFYLQNIGRNDTQHGAVSIEIRDTVDGDIDYDDSPGGSQETVRIRVGDRISKDAITNATVSITNNPYVSDAAKDACELIGQDIVFSGNLTHTGSGVYEIIVPVLCPDPVSKNFDIEISAPKYNSESIIAQNISGGLNLPFVELCLKTVCSSKGEITGSIEYKDRTTGNLISCDNRTVLNAKGDPVDHVEGNVKNNVNSSGEFHLTGVVPGKYTLEGYCRDNKSSIYKFEKKIDLKAGGSLDVEIIASYDKEVGDKRTPYETSIFSGCGEIEGKILNCWLGKVFSWSQIVIGSLAVVMIMIGGIIYMTSAGDPDRMGLAKKLIFGALIGVTVIILGRFFLYTILGVPKP